MNGLPNLMTGTRYHRAIPPTRFEGWQCFDLTGKASDGKTRTVFGAVVAANDPKTYNDVRRAHVWKHTGRDIIESDFDTDEMPPDQYRDAGPDTVVCSE